MINLRDTMYGFIYGAAKVERIASDAKKGWVVIGVSSNKTSVQVYVTKTGKIRIYRDNEELL